MKNKLLNLIRKRRRFEYRTLDGYKPTDPLIHRLLSEEIELEMKKIGAKNKTILRREAKDNPFLREILKRGECQKRIHFYGKN